MGLLVGSQSAALTAGLLVPLASIEAEIRSWPDASRREKLALDRPDFAREAGKEDVF